MSFSAADRPRLATPAQQVAEHTLIRLLRDPELRRVKTAIRDGLAATPRGTTPSGAATLDRAVDLWTNSLTLAEISVHQPVPAFTWGTDNTPRNWLGYTLPGVGTSGPRGQAHRTRRPGPPTGHTGTTRGPDDRTHRGIRGPHVLTTYTAPVNARDRHRRRIRTAAAFEVGQTKGLFVSCRS